MKYAKPLSIAAALAIGLISMDAFAATPNIDTPPTHATRKATTSEATYFIADPGTAKAHRVYYFNRLDTNHNGQLSRSEIPRDMVMLRMHFDAVDFNKNGQLSPAEIWLWTHNAAPQFISTYPALVLVYKY